MPQPPTAKEFLRKFLKSFTECLGEANETDNVWQHWTEFMTGKKGEKGGYWKKDRVLEKTAENLGLKHEREYLALDLVLFSPGDSWGNFVALEDEHNIATFGQEIEKLMSVLAPLKVGITYDFRGNLETHSKLVQLIKEDFSTRHPSILEAPQTEYLFLLGVGSTSDTLKWKYLAFTCAQGPASEFLDAGEEPRTAGAS